MNKLSTICVQNISDKKNFQKLTKNKINVLGNLKFDQSPPKNTLKKSRILKRNLKLSKQTVIVLGSSRDGEEGNYSPSNFNDEYERYYPYPCTKTPRKI